ncbi:hypothetical protein BST81_02290 [Leptolyngbya sp. 'hensonii']|uniref:metal-dependent hydrolase n=1 Tax=Leptolyngbya sp. 'hensonii' TaxID=1922337 RepID=UPI000950218D|nr:metal-dependent hydrolase [Leptolyngbya sp. 'hensonii']OLP20087.1 hypothetical protein BST81_02290 [Leptolyngbya sp. 'hensonii']
MMSVTHCSIALATTSIALATADPFVLLTAAIGSQIPDIDTTESFMGRILYPIAHWIEARYPHRTITHSFLATGAVAALGAPLLWLNWHFWAALVLGHFCGWLSDAFTKAGVAAFYPSPARLVIPGNPRARLESKSPSEYWVLAVSLFLCVVSVNLISAGGITEQFELFFMRGSETAADMFRKYGSERTIVVEVSGIHTHTSQRITGSFAVIEATASDVVAEEQGTGRLYKIGNGADVQIRPTRIRTQLGERLSLQVQEMTLREIAVSDWVKRLPPNGDVSGSLLLDDTEEVQIPLEIQTYPVLRATGNRVELSHARPEQVRGLLRDFWILSGRVIVKVRG